MGFEPGQAPVPSHLLRAGRAPTLELRGNRVDVMANQPSSQKIDFYSEGVRLSGDLFLPGDLKAGEKRAGILLCHGYTGVRNLYLPDNARVLTEAGYVVLTF